MGKQLREYQLNGIKQIFEHWKAGKQSVLFQMPTGTGKTVLFSSIVKMGSERSRKILIVVHRIELVKQITTHLEDEGIMVGRIVSGRKNDYSYEIQVASIQTLFRRPAPEADLIIIDECHHAKAETYRNLWVIYPNAKFLGVTATPIRLNGEGFDDLFDVLVESPSIQHFIDKGYLVPVNYFVGANPDLSGVKKQKGDYITKMLSEVMMEGSIMSDLIESYQDKCNGKSAIVFAVDVEHSKEIVERYKKVGIEASHIDSKTPLDQREQILSDFKEGIIKVVSNVEIITEGFDFPECEVVQLARPTKSLVLYLQMVGRVMRPAKNKKEGIILDNAGLWREHRLATADRIWSLTGTKKHKKGSYSTEEVLGLDEEGVVRRVNRNRPIELKNLKLIPLSQEMERLIEFESILSRSRKYEQNLLRVYFIYKEKLIEKNAQISQTEFQYIKKQLNRFNKTMPSEHQFKPGFWYNEEKQVFGNQK